MKRLALLAVSLSALSAFAQEIQAPPPAPPPSVPADAPVEDPGGRIRWGVSGNLGWNFPSPAFTLGAEGRIGWQISNAFSAYAIVGGTAGIGLGVNAGINGAAVSVTALSYWYLGAIAELMLGNLFYVGGGVVGASSSYVGAVVSATADGRAKESVLTSTGFAPGLDLRLGLGFGRQQPAPSFRRGGFNLGIDAMMLFHPNTTIATVEADANGNAGATVTTTGLSVNVVPMLTLGYDWR